MVRATAATTSNYLTGYIDATFTVTLAAPAFTLSSSSESKAQNVAIAGYTITSTGGTIASYAISPAAPAGLTFSTSTGLLTGTPTTVQSATAYTITATNATGTATATFTLTVTAAATCATGGVCAVGDTGPGGGVVFYVHASGTFACGSTLASTCKYLEVAPSGWNTGADPTKLWAVVAHQSSDIATITNDSSVYNNASGIGLGYKNSIAIVNQGNDTTTAAGAARAYAGGSKSDWYLPTTAELNLLCQWARNVAQSVTTACTGGTLNTGTGASGGFSTFYYWSSSEKYGSLAWLQVFDVGTQGGGGGKGSSFCVRPVRAFG